MHIINRGESIEEGLIDNDTYIRYTTCFYISYK
jgi:hypothetical protein